jgi:hypothetical protein
MDHATVLAPLDSLHAHPRNYRVHPPEQLDHIARSIELHGFYRNIVVARDHTILAGHGVVAAARRLGFADVPVIRLDVGPEDVPALQILTGDNEMSNLAEVDDRELTELLRELAGDDLANLLGTGFDEYQLAALAMVTRPRHEMADMDEAGEWLGLPGFEAAARDPHVDVKFLSIEDRDRFMAEVLGPEHKVVKKVGDAWTVWWPSKPKNDRQSIRFEDRIVDLVNDV